MEVSNIDKDSWKIVQCYFKENDLVKHQTESFNDCILKKIDEIIEGFNPIDVHHQYIPEEEKFKYILSIHVKNPVLSKPMIFEKDGSTKIMTPNDARQRNFTYASPLNVDIDINCQTFDEVTKTYTSELKKLSNINLGKIPIMVKSRYCVLNTQPNTNTIHECQKDPGGHFIINGNEKVIISQDRICENRTFVFINNKQSSAFSHVAEIRSVAENKFGVPKTTTLKLSAKANQFGRFIRCNIHHIKNDIPLTVLFKALGIESDKEILSFIVGDVKDPANERLINEMVGSIDEGNDVLCSRDALEYLSKYLHINGYPKEFLNNKVQRLNILRNVLEKEFLPHVGTDFRKKALYLGYMVKKLLNCYTGVWEFDDRDSYINKRVDTPGILLANLIRQYYGKVIKTMKDIIQKEINTGSWKATGKFNNVINKVNIYKIVKSTILESGLKYALATGNWGIKSNKNKQGVAQVLNRMTYNATLSHLRRVNTPLEKTGKLVAPRKLHSTNFGFICPAETPEGASVGLVKNLAMMANITISSNSINVRLILEELGTVMFDGTNAIDFQNKTKVVINGDIIGYHEEPMTIYNALKQLKISGAINVMTGITWNVPRKEIHINTEGGRCTRPVFVVKDNKLVITNKVLEDVASGKISWRHIVLDGYIEYLDVEEHNMCMIAMKPGDLVRGRKGANEQPNYTHMEIHPSLILGVVAGSIPFSNHNQAPRNCYQSAMAKQALGLYASNFQHRFDTMAHVLNYPQKAIVQTKISKLIRTDDMPCGFNVVIAIATYTGFNQEDSVLVNQSAIDRGLFGSTFYRTYKEQCNKNHSNGEEEFFTKPNPHNTKNMKPFNYDKLNESGFVPEGTFVDNGDIIIGKCMPQKMETAIVNKCTSVCLKGNEIGFVDKNCFGDKYFTNTNGDGYQFTKVRIRQTRVPTIGDKFSSRHGQHSAVVKASKGLC